MTSTEPKVEPKVETTEPKTEEPKVEAKVEATTFDPETFKLPDGMTADKETLGKFAALVNDDKLSAADRGAKLVELHTGLLKQAGETSTAAFKTLNETWVKEVKADPDIGGAKLEPTRQMIAGAIDKLPAKDAAAFREAMDVTGAGNNPAVIRALAHWAKSLTEGTPVIGTPPSPKQDLAASFFPNSPGMQKGN